MKAKKEIQQEIKDLETKIKEDRKLINSGLYLGSYEEGSLIDRIHKMKRRIHVLKSTLSQ